MKKNKIIYLFLAVLVIGLYTYFDIKESKLLKYKSLITVEETVFDNISQREAVDLLILQEKDLLFYLKTHLFVNADKLFSTFYDNLITFAGSDLHSYNKNLLIKPDYSKDTFVQYGISFNNETVGDRIQPVISKPQAKFFVMEYLDDGGWVVAINYDYLFGSFSNRLSEPWQEYLKLLAKEQKSQNNNFYYRKSKPTISKDKIAQRIISERKFLEDNSNFALSDMLNKNIDLLVEDYLSDDDSTFKYDDKGNMVVKKEVRKSYESFLVKADKSTKEYKQVHNWYEMLKSYDFIRPVTGLTKFDTKNIIYKDVYLAQQLEEVEVFTARIKNIVKTKDIKMLADNVLYPLNIEFADGNVINISDKSQLLGLRKDKIFTNELVLSISSSKKALPSVKGFTVGNPQEISFDFVEDGSLMISKINLRPSLKNLVIDVE